MARTFSRTPLACNFCRRRKTKCDGVRPRCTHCRVKNLTCAWPTADAPSGRSPICGQAVIPGMAVADNSISPTPSSSLLTSEPNPRGLQHCLGIFFERHFASDFCSFDHRPDFELKCKQDQLLGCALVALCGRYVDAPDIQALFGLASSSPEMIRLYLHKARYLAKMVSDEPSVSHIQGHLILAMAELLSNSGSRHWLFLGTAIRMAEIMRLNKDFHEKHSLKEQEIRRRTFWACLLFDRSLAYLLAKHRTVSLENVSIAVPGTDSSLVYQEPTRGVTLSSLATYRRPSELGISPYFVKTVCIWSDLADFALKSRRHQDAFPPTDPRGVFFTRSASLLDWVGSLPQSLLWSERNYEGQAALGHAHSFVAMQFLLCSASCVAHQCYLPHLTLYTKLVDLVDAAGLSYLHRDPILIDTCVASALKVGEMLQFLVDPARTDDVSSLQSVWVASSLVIVANTFLWLQYSEDEACRTPGVRDKAKQFTALIQQVVASWTPHWKAAQRWLVALSVMHGLYKAAYLGEIDEGILGLSGREDSHSDDNSADDFRPQPGDGYPCAISLPTLQSSVKFATSDTSAKAISVQSIWLQLCGGWPYGDFELGHIDDTVAQDIAQFSVLNSDTQPDL